VTAVLKSELRAAVYRAHAREALAAANDSGLLLARRRHEDAAAAWLTLAEQEDARTLSAREGRVQALAKRRPAAVREPPKC
jgi:hypothetical protein